MQCNLTTYTSTIHWALKLFPKLLTAIESREDEMRHTNDVVAARTLVLRVFARVAHARDERQWPAHKQHQTPSA